MAVADLAAVLQATPAQVLQGLAELERALQGRGLMLVRNGDEMQLATVPEAAADVERYLRSEELVSLSSAAMETLAIIAYRQPVTRAHIEMVRGVSSESPLRTLVRLGLVNELDRLDQPGRPIAYGTTPAFLRLFGLSSTEQLLPLTSDSA